MKNIPIFRPCYDKREEEAVGRVLQSGWSGMGPETERFEQAFAKKVGSKYAVALNSCTAALHLAYLTHIQPGDEVIVPPITFVSTAHCVLLAGGKPVFADVEPDSLLLDMRDVEKKITPKTKLIVPVLYAGQVREYRSDIPIIYDCAHALGSTFNAKGKTCCWSFHAVKNISCGDGGMITTDDDNVASRCRRLRWLGIDKSTWERSGNESYWWEYCVKEIGYKYHTNDILAAIALVQLEKLEELQEKRLKLVNQYLNELDGYVGLPNFHGSSWHLFVIRVENRNKLSLKLKECGMATGVHYKPIHKYACYNSDISLPVAEKEWQSILTLPLFPDLSSDDVMDICKVIREFSK